MKDIQTINGNKEEKNRVIIYDVLRVIAIILVLISHSAYINNVSEYGGVSYSGYIFSKLYVFIRHDIKIYIYFSYAIICIYFRSIIL